MAKTKRTVIKYLKADSKPLSQNIIKKIKDKTNDEYDSSDSDKNEGSELGIEYSIFSGKNFTMNPTFTILYHNNNIKKQVSLNFFDSIKAFKILRHWILLNYSGKSGFIATEEEKKELLGKWLKIHKKSFQPTIVDKIFISSSAAREKFIPKLARKTTAIPELNFKDSNSINSSTSSKLKQIKKESFKKKSIVIDEQSEKLNLEELSNKSRTILKSKDLNKYYKKSKKQIQRIRKKKKYLDYREENNCFLFSLRHITGKFSFMNYMFHFKNLTIDKQLEFANQILKQNSSKALNNTGKFIGTLNQLKKILNGSFLFLFFIDGLLHSESLVNGEFNPLMQEQVKTILDTKMSIDIYRYD